ncbi:spore gernimation protein [Paenibacillus selenitireducens]|uniref:Spore gernimation protein n=1 Tax=Paenibacillus selenitireducens TaxID=1324314 RepID=A0A1T2XKJ0_9BACL|nr:endospore germination permease [Paenibacillus selenitireducens]OPA80387.1 spore gernimation protein [Paenibacillus selenitireducens]
MGIFNYADEEIGQREITMTVASMIIGLGVLTLPRLVASETMSSDGWISILVAGGIALFFGWIVSKLCGRFKRMTFYEYTSLIVTKPVAYVLTLLQAVYFLMFCAYEMRAVASISKQYLFDRTPIEVIALTFLLVVIVAVSGSRVGIIRLCVLFLPIVLFFVIVMLAFSVELFEWENLKPMFITDGKHIYSGARQVIYSMLGYEIVMFYSILMRKPKESTKAIIIGISIPILLYLIIFIIAIGIFTREGTINIMYPAIEIAKEIEIPGQFFERFESVLFIIWIMTLYNTSSIVMDVSVHCLTSAIKKLDKRTCLLILSPIIFLISMFPKDQVEYVYLGTIISIMGIAFAAIIPTSLLIVAAIRGVQSSD